MLKDLTNALQKFNNHAGHNCKLIINDNGIIHIYQTYGKMDCKHWDYIYESFDCFENCIQWLNSN